MRFLRMSGIGHSTEENHMAEVREGALRESENPIQFAGSVLGAQRHVCAFFHSPDEEYRVLLPFITEGFERGDKACHIVDPELRAEHLRQLESARLLSEQRRAAEEFEERVVERTRQLTAVNEELRKEIIERERAEQALITS